MKFNSDLWLKIGGLTNKNTKIKSKKIMNQISIVYCII